MKPEEFFGKFQGMEPDEQKELDVEAIVRVLWVDPFRHRTTPWEITKGLENRKYVEEDPKYLMKGTFDSKECTVEIERITPGQIVSEGEFDLCITSMTHDKIISDAECIRKVLEPYVNRAAYTVYRNCCHKKGREAAMQFNPSHPVCLEIGYEIAREIVIDLLMGEKAYIACGTDFAKAAEIAKQRGDQRREEIYTRFERLRVADET